MPSFTNPFQVVVMIWDTLTMSFERFADLEQWPGVGPFSPGIILPCQLTHGSIYSWIRKGCLHPMEMLQAHGYNVFPGSSRKYPSQMTDFFKTQTTNSNLILAGNGWHLPSMASWIVYVLSNVTRRPPIPSPSAGLASLPADPLLDDDDADTQTFQ